MNLAHLVAPSAGLAKWLRGERHVQQLLALFFGQATAGDPVQQALPAQGTDPSMATCGGPQR
eukprot:4806635-Alexandrium_andersonii.AAC.1